MPSMSTGAGSTWSKEETLKLIEVWGQENIQKQLQECKRNQTVYEDVAKQMREAGHERTYQQDREAESTKRTRREDGLPGIFSM